MLAPKLTSPPFQQCQETKTYRRSQWEADLEEIVGRKLDLWVHHYVKLKLTLKSEKFILN